LTQRADGYLHTPVLIKQRQGDPGARPFQDRLNFEMYNFGHLLTAACVHHPATGKRNLLDVALKAADYLHAAFQQPPPELARHAVCPSHYMGMVELYRTTGERKYLRLAETFVNLRDRVEAVRMTTRTASPSASRPRPSVTPCAPTTSTPASRTSTRRRATG